MIYRIHNIATFLQIWKEEIIDIMYDDGGHFSCFPCGLKFNLWG